MVATAFFTDYPALIDVVSRIVVHTVQSGFVFLRTSSRKRKGLQPDCHLLRDHSPSFRPSHDSDTVSTFHLPMTSLCVCVSALNTHHTHTHILSLSRWDRMSLDAVIYCVVICWSGEMDAGQ